MSERDDSIIRAWREEDDETFVRLISESNLDAALRPRDEFDVDVHPESLRGKVLEFYDAMDRLPWWVRLGGRIMARLRR